MNITADVIWQKPSRNIACPLAHVAPPCSVRRTASCGVFDVISPGGTACNRVFLLQKFGTCTVTAERDGRTLSSQRKSPLLSQPRPCPLLFITSFLLSWWHETALHSRRECEGRPRSDVPSSEGREGEEASKELLRQIGQEVWKLLR